MRGWLRRIMAATLCFGLLATACGGGATTAADTSEEATGGTPAATDGTPAATGSSEDPFPVTVEHALGSTVIEQEPQRVVALGESDADALLALGVTPVAVSADDWVRERAPNGIWPWQEGLYGDAPPPEVITPPAIAVEYEAIAALQPDLILALYTELDQNMYEKLSAIAPTVAQSGEYGAYQTPWREMARTAGQAMGKSALAEERIAEVEAAFAAAREAHPEFEGSTAVYAAYVDAGEYVAEAGESTRVGILTDLGFELPEEISQIAGDNFYAEISQERLDLFDQDVVLWEARGAERKSIEDNPLYQHLNAHKEGRAVFIEDDALQGALVLPSVVSIPYLLDDLVPRIAAAIDGDPATSAE